MAYMEVLGNVVERERSVREKWWKKERRKGGKVGGRRKVLEDSGFGSSRDGW